MNQEGERGDETEHAEEIADKTVKILGFTRNKQQEQRAYQRREQDHAEKMI
jgi:hypothetical protein